MFLIRGFSAEGFALIALLALSASATPGLDTRPQPFPMQSLSHHTYQRASYAGPIDQHNPTKFEDNQPTSPISLTARDLSTLKGDMGILLAHFVAFAKSDKAIPSLVAFLDEVRSLVNKQSISEFTQNVLSATYGGLKLTIRGTGALIWPYIDAFLQSMIEKVQAGLAGFFVAQLHAFKNVLGSAVVITIILSRVVDGPRELGGIETNLLG